MALGAAMTLHPDATLDLTLFKLVSDVLGGLSATHAIKVEHIAGTGGRGA